MPMFVPPLLLTALCVVLAARAPGERLVVGWLLWSGMIHIFMELSYGFFPDEVVRRSAITFSEFMVQPTSVFGFLDPHWWAHMYEQYARYDGRYLDHDPVILLITQVELLMGPACLLLVALIARRSPYRHPVQLMLCTAQIYGTYVYFFTPIYRGDWSVTMTHELFDLWTYVIFLNGLWIVIPALLIVQSLRAVVPVQRLLADGSPA